MRNPLSVRTENAGSAKIKTCFPHTSLRVTAWPAGLHTGLRLQPYSWTLTPTPMLNTLGGVHTCTCNCFLNWLLLGSEKTSNCKWLKFLSSEKQQSLSLHRACSSFIKTQQIKICLPAASLKHHCSQVSNAKPDLSLQTGFGENGADGMPAHAPITMAAPQCYRESKALYACIN